MKPLKYLFLFLLSPWKLWAQSPQLDLLIQKGLEYNLQIKAKQWEIMTSEENEKTAFELAKTNFGLLFGHNDGFYYNDAITLGQTLPLPAQKKAKKSWLEIQTQGKAIQKELAEQELKYQIRNAYYQWAYFKTKQTELQKLDSLYEQFLKITELRYNTGESPQADVHLAQTQRGDIRLQLEENQLALQKNESNIERLTSVKGSELTSNLNSLILQASPSELLDVPFLKKFQNDIKSLEAQKKVDKLANLPDIHLSYTNGSLMGNQEKNGVEKYYGREQRFGYVEVGVSVPLYKQGTKAKVNALQLQQKALQNQLDYEKQNLEMMLSQSYKLLEQQHSKLNYFINEAIPNSKKIVDAAWLGYSKGDKTFIEFLYSVNTATDIQVRYLESLRDAHLNSALIAYLLNL